MGGGVELWRGGGQKDVPRCVHYTNEPQTRNSVTGLHWWWTSIVIVYAISTPSTSGYHPALSWCQSPLTFLWIPKGGSTDRLSFLHSGDIRFWHVFVSFYKIKLITSVCIHRYRGLHGSIKYCLVRVLFFNTELRIPDHYRFPIWIVYQYLTAMASRRSLFNRNCLVTDPDHSSLFNRNGLVADQSLTAMARRLEFNSNCKPRIIILARLIRS